MLASLGGLAPAVADNSLPDLDQVDPAIYDYGSAIVEHHLLPNRDSSAVSWVDIIRPDTTTPVPTIIDSSPYFNTLGRGWKGELKDPFDPAIAAADLTYAGGPRVPFPEWYDEYFVPRGYAVALIDLHGTRNSTGCQVYGGREEVYDTVDDIDWLVSQAWSNGRVGLIGGSYDGTIANGAAAEMPISGQHKDAVAAVIPVRAIDRWYDYQMMNGVTANGQNLDPEEFTALFPAEDTPNSGTGGDPNYAADLLQRKTCPLIGQTTDVQYLGPYQDADNATFWQPRDFLKDAPTWRAATFFMHGQFDYNVKTHNTGQLWEALPPSVPKKFWFFNGDHLDPDLPSPEDAAAHGYLLPYAFQQKYHEGVHRWFLQFLKGIDSGALRTPTVEVQRDDGHWDGYDQYPAPGTDRVLHFGPNGTAVDGDPSTGTVTWDDSPAMFLAPASQVFTTEPVTEDTRISGQMQFDLAFSADGIDTTIGVEVEDLPPGDPANAPQYDLYDGTNQGPFAFDYAFIRPWYRDTINPRGASTPSGGGPLTPGQTYNISFPSLYTDYILHAGHRLRFTFGDQAGGLSVAAMTGNIVSLQLGPDKSDVRIPVAAPPPIVLPEPPLETPTVLPNTATGSAGAALLLAAGLATVVAALGRRRRRRV
ncbi:MAG: X-Pro dipeptidyl-peptidase [Chloroflexota bacterium]|nr:X-Pro dipeptidyl-peptidase [Chloroflexota bacterium]